MEQWIERAVKTGFTKACPLDCATLSFRPEVRGMCRTNSCGKYGKNWCCPPACGSLDDCAKTASRYHTGFIVELVGIPDDPFDINGMLAIGQRHRALFTSFAQELKTSWPLLLALGAGTCTQCQQCAYPNGACRFPHLAFPSMEAYGLLVSEVCEANGIPYYHGKGTVTFVGCYLLE